MSGEEGHGCEMANGYYSWLTIFQVFDTNYDGYIATHDLRRFVRNSATSFGLSRQEADALLQNIDKNGDHLLDFAEFCTLMSKAKKLRMRHVLFRAAQMVVPRSSRTIAAYVYYVVRLRSGIELYGPVPQKSLLIFNPYKTNEVWRYFTYMFIHIGIIHLAFNILTQIVLGIPLELVHKFWRIALVYLSGVLAGSLLDYAIDPRTHLAGASGGVYALLAAHIAELLINWAEMEFALYRALVLLVLISSDVSLAIYHRYYLNTTDKVSHVSHLAGFVAGVLMGTVVLRNFRKKNWERIVWWIAFTVTGSSFSILVLLNIIPHI
ncbi:Uncharacterized protein BM_BM2827 [Brugia malayi]|uniref:EF-hand domain-containing protein n=1 Tax=Brugia malayi TaxID=6279 RepID=A0A4E9FBY2_BRUMA|nr:Uncharacterized protein BM_BM2827 [Brugia malayi]VIO91149.1 Uncharacterized protein BM_BM2827 [Brugia malayi]